MPKSAVISRDPEVMGGTPVFRGTRVPVQILLDHLEGGDSIDEFPSVSREQVIGFWKRRETGFLETVE